MGSQMKIKEITSLQNPMIKHFVKLRQNGDYRHEHQTAVIEGPKLIREVCAEKPAKVIIAYDESYIPQDVQTDELLIVSEDIMHKISGVQSSEGIIAEVELPKPASLEQKHFVIAIDGVSDPGNLGTILRTALALGWEGVFILPDSCDPFNEKALRASRGAVFRLPTAFGTWADLKKLIENNQFTPLVADLSGTELAKLKIPEKMILVLSNEAHGVSADARSVCQPITIPMPGIMESLNVSVAGGILMYNLRARL
jgi:TrmH family RNA methyltransferase